MHILNELTYINKSSLALGFFDGLHQGHKVVLKNAVKSAISSEGKSCVIMFTSHPGNVLFPNKVEQILTLDEKLKMIEECGIDYVFLLKFEEYKNMKANDYIENILIKYFNPYSVTTGFNHTFGFKKEGNTQLLLEYSRKYNYKYYEIPPYVIDNRIVSSSEIRNTLHLGDFKLANELLGYNFFIQGRVIHGEHLASALGFASANIEYPENKIKIPFGVYFVKVTVNNKTYNGVMNYGIVNSSDNTLKLKSEVHILDFNKNIYGENIKVEFITKIRNQMDFDNIEKLKYQINRDIGFVEIYKYFLKDKFNIHCKNFII